MSARILVADDSVTIQKVVELTFSKENFEIVPARSGDEALQKARAHPPDIMLIDAVMPDKSGYEVCRLVRAEPALKNVPVILLTGTFEPFDKAEGVRAGANDFVTKPFDSQTLLTKVKQLLASQPAAPVTAAPAPPAAAPAPAPARETLSSESFWNLMEMEKEEKVPSAPSPQPPPPAPRPASPPPASISLEEVMEEPEKAVPTYELPSSESSASGAETLGDVARSLGIEVDFKPVVPPAPREAPAHPTAPPPPPPSAPREVAPPRPTPPPPATTASRGEVSEAVKQQVAERVASTIGKEIHELVKKKVEQVVWEVVPDLAEVLIREELERIRAEAEGKKPR